MISKERLKELIKQGATIYSTTWKEEIDLSQYWCEVFEMEWNGKIITRLVVHYDDEQCPLYLLEGLTEDIEDAKWEEEFGCIERPIKLALPNWFEFKNRDRNIGFTFEDYSYKCFTDGKEIEILQFWGRGGRSVFKAPLTRENYTLACRKCKELFLGGSDGDIR